MSTRAIPSQRIASTQHPSAMGSSQRNFGLTSALLHNSPANQEAAKSFRREPPATPRHATLGTPGRRGLPQRAPTETATQPSRSTGRAGSGLVIAVAKLLPTSYTTYTRSPEGKHYCCGKSSLPECPSSLQVRSQFMQTTRRHGHWSHHRSPVPTTAAESRIIHERIATPIGFLYRPVILLLFQ